MTSIPYKIVNRTVYSKEEKKVVFVPRISNAGKVSTKSLLSQIAVESTISDNETKRFIDGFALVIRQALQNGIRIKLGKLGTFTPTVQFKTVDEEADATPDTAVGKTIVYRASITVGKKLKTAKLRKINLNLEYV